MHLNADISSALQQLEAIKTAVDQSDDAKLQNATADDFALILGLLENPVFRSIVTLQDSMGMLATQIAHHPSILPGDFDITPAGELALQTRGLYGGLDGEEEQRVPQLSPPHSLGYTVLGAPQERESGERILAIDGPPIDANISHQQAISILQQARGLVELVVARGGGTEDGAPPPLPASSPPLLPSDWAQVEAIHLVNDGTGLGFGIIGARTSGVIVKTILPGGVADRDGRLKSGDHILQIGDVVLIEMVSEQVAGVLRRSGTHVRLVVARPADPTSSAGPTLSDAPVVPTRLLSDLEALDHYLTDAGFPEIFNSQVTPSPTPPLPDKAFLYDGDTADDSDTVGPIPLDHLEIDLPETEKFTVQLKKDENGLGITIAGYVCEKEELSGIFVKSVTTGSAAARSGRIRVNDRIVAVDGASLHGRSNHCAVDALRSSGSTVTLSLERYLRGPKFEQLQQAIAANELGPAPTAVVAPAQPANPFLHLHRLDSETDSQLTHIPMSQLNKLGSFGMSQSTASGSLRFPVNQLDCDNLSNNSLDDADILVETSNLALGITRGLTHPAGQNAPGFEIPVTDEMEEAICNKWKLILGSAIEIVVGVVVKGGGGLGISLEGTVDVEEGGREVRPHHYIRSVLPEGPVGRATKLRSGDELLEVNGHRLLGMNHLEVVSILKELPPQVCLVCARTANGASGSGDSAVGVVSGAAVGGALVKAKSDGSLAGAGGGVGGTGGRGDSECGSGTSGSSTGGGSLSGARLRSRSLEPLTGLAMWSSEPQIIELVKGERGLGFSILDYQDPLRPAHAVIVIRSLVPGGVAQQDGRLIPGDRLLTVNDQILENATLDQAVQALKGAPRGTVRIGVAKPLPLADCIPANGMPVPSLPHNKMNTQ